MASFIVYDLAFLVIFTVIAGFLLHRNKKNLKRHGWIFLYHSKVGIKFIDWFAKKFGKVLRPLSYVVISVGYILMAGILWLISRSVWVYVSSPIPEQLRNLPPIAPLIPYFPNLFNLESLFPPLYFTYFLIALAIVAVSHEAAHGIFARLYKIKIKTTGLAFFGPFFGAFVEQDDKDMNKAKKFEQLSVLGAGVFANVIMTIIFALIMWGFFAVSFAPAGAYFNTYAQSPVEVSDIILVGNTLVLSESQIPALAKEGLNEITVQGGDKYLVPDNLLTEEIISNNERIPGFDYAPAINAKLEGAIRSIGDYEVRSQEDLVGAINSYSPGDDVVIETIDPEGLVERYEIEFAEKEGKAYLGIGFYSQERRGLGKLYNVITAVKDPGILYQPTWDGDFVQFIYDLLWWIVVINILVALMNMLPVSILDGGRFFYLTIWGITKNEKIGKKAYAIVTWFILLLLILMMGKWFVNLFS